MRSISANRASSRKAMRPMPSSAVLRVVEVARVYAAGRTALAA
ncbi:hypothetical protein QF034_000025 [Streptomyces africanus]|uniref:ABC transporter ATP-binding protein n=1 Tax=Streptomyces africanus TaxID=231024 RepID=A0ABU0QEH1_9ACTN|nr:hypothetical protein [Streptomyces africanus]MDQ0745794.1 hypothetical protein [Streptomyces africanus]